ncbi:Gag polyprotein [Plecturocebus cupreus]
MNLSKTTEVVQGPHESPGVFLEYFQEAYQIYTPFDPVAPENSSAINLAFVAQAAPDIRKQLQKLAGFAEMNITQLPEIPQKDFDNRDHEKQKQAALAAEKASRRQAKILVATLQETKQES